MFEILFNSHDFGYLVFQIAGVGKKKGAVEAHHGHVFAFPQAVGRYAAQGFVLGPGQGNHAGTHALVKKDHQGEHDPDHDPLVQMGGKRQGADERNDRDGTVVPFGFPGVDEAGNVYQADDGHHDDRCQDSLRQMIEQRGEKQQHDHNRQTGKDARQSGNGPGLKIDCRTRKRSGCRITLADRTADIGQPLTDEFLIGVEALSGFAGHGLGDGDRFHESQQ